LDFVERTLILSGFHFQLFQVTWVKGSPPNV
jgi:hypothetical protein